MKLHYMKQAALDYLKANMSSLYVNYFRFDTPDWILDLFDYDPFGVFAEVPDFELANLDQQPGEIVLQNCKILYTKLKDISDSQASDERLWAGLCNSTFYSYVRSRWQIARKHFKKTKDDSTAILSNFFYKNAGRSGMFRNSLARCWWTGRLTYSKDLPDHWELLDAIGSEDITSKISDIFYSNSYSSNPTVVEGFCEGLKFFRDRNIKVANREHIRPTAQYLNAVGGGLLLDMLASDEIKKLVVERMGLLINGNDSGIASELDSDEDDVYEDEVSPDDLSTETVNVDFEDYLDSLETTSAIDLDAVLGELTTVEYGCTVYVRNVIEDKCFTSSMPMVGEELNQLQIHFLGKPIGYTWKLGSREYEIVDIRR